MNKGSGGLKLDDRKVDYSLADVEAEREVAAVLTVGAIKYDRGNWVHVEDAGNRYYSAVRRHLDAFRAGERLDPETGLHHLAHAACCVHFLLAADLFHPDGPKDLRATFGERFRRALEIARDLRKARLAAKK